MASIQSEAVQLAMDLLVTHPDLRGFFRGFIKRLVDDSEAHACGVWLLDEATGACDLWMANIRGETFAPDSPGWASLDLPRESMSRHLDSSEEALTTVLEYEGDDARLPEPVRAFNRASEVRVLLVAPLRLAPRTLGWIALSSVQDSSCERQWRRALLDATAKQATLALYYTRQVEQSLLEARRRRARGAQLHARDIHDTLAVGAIPMQLRRRSGGVASPAARSPRPRSIPPARISSRPAVRLRRCGRPPPRPADREDVCTALRRMAIWRSTGDVPIELAADELPAFDAGPSAIIGIAREALTNAVRHRAPAASSPAPARCAGGLPPVGGRRRPRHHRGSRPPASA